MKYRNVSKLPQMLIGYGVIEPDGIVELKQKPNNNFEMVKTKKVEPVYSTGHKKRRQKNKWK